MLSMLAIAENAAVPEKNPNYRVSTISDIKSIYDQLPAEPSSGRLVRESYLIWALSNYLTDKACLNCEVDDIDSIANFEVFKKSYFPTFDREVAQIAQDNPAFLDIANIAIHAVYRYILGRYSRVWQEGHEHYNEPVVKLLESYKTKEYSSKLQNPFIREALTLIQRRNIFVSHYRECEQFASGHDMFVLARLDTAPYTTKSKVSLEQREASAFSISPVAGREFAATGDTTIAVEGYFHPMVKFSQNIPVSRVFIGRMQVSTSEFMISLGEYLDSPAFLRYPYGENLAQGEDINAKYNFLHEGPDLHNSILADIRCIYIKKNFTISKDIRHLCDPNDPAYSILMDLMVTNDHAELPNGKMVLEELQKYSPSEIEKYNEYMSKSEAFLVATYKKTVSSKAIATTIEHKKSCVFVSPDYTLEPQLNIVYLPREWLRHACFYGLQTILFDYNLIGLGDLTIHPPESMPLGF